MIIYHNHIPRTSGYVINKYIEQEKGFTKLIIDPAGKIKQEDFLNKDYIAGHIGMYPQKFLNDVVCFSIVREPYEQFISWFYFMWLQGVTWENGKVVKSYYGQPLEFMDKYLNGGEYLDGLTNIQSKFLTGYVDLDTWNSTPEPIDKTKRSWCLTNYKLNEDNIMSAINNNIINTLHKREYLIDKVNTLFTKKLGKEFKIGTFDMSGHNTPENNPYAFVMPDSWKKRIISALEIDYYLYHTVLDVEKTML